MFENENTLDMLVKLKAPAGQLKKLRKLELPTEAKVRLVLVIIYSLIGSANSTAKAIASLR
jgi:hypothetical protein